MPKKSIDFSSFVNNANGQTHRIDRSRCDTVANFIIKENVEIEISHSVVFRHCKTESISCAFTVLKILSVVSMGFTITTVLLRVKCGF